MSAERIFEKLDEIQQSVTRLETHMKTLIGNGQPGKITRIEGTLIEHEALINQAKGAKWLVGLIAALLALIAREVIAAVLK